MDFRIRDATPADLPEIVRLCGELAEFEEAEYSPEGKAEKLAKLLFSDSLRMSCLIAEGIDGQVLGYATFMAELSTWEADFFIHVDCLFLRPQARGLGIGKQLVKEIAARAINMECKQIQWQTPSSNERGIHFYRRLGAVSKDKLRFCLDETTIAKLAN